MAIPPDLVPCNEPGYIKDVNIDPPPPYCRDEPTESQKDVAGRDTSWLLEPTLKKSGVGQHANLDPMQTGHLINNQAGRSDPQTLYRYTQAIRGSDEGMKDLFSDLVVIDEQGAAHNIPIIHATQEKAVAAIIQENYRKDNSLVVDAIRLPMLAIHSSDLEFSQKRYIYHEATDYLRDFRERNGKPGFTMKEQRHERDTVFGVARGLPIDIGYTLWAWTLHREDMNQIVEQILLKFSPIAYIRVRGVSWEVGVKLDSIGNNIEVDPGDQAINVYKYQFKMTAETFIPQPLKRRKAVLKTRTEIVDSVEDESLSEVIAKLEEAVKDLE